MKLKLYKFFLLYVIILLLLVLCACAQHNKSELDLFIEQYYQHHPKSYALEPGWYEIDTHEYHYNQNNQKKMIDKNYVGYIKFDIGSFAGKLSDFTYKSRTSVFHKNVLTEYSEKNIIVYQNRYLEETLSNNESNITYGCNDLLSKNISFTINASNSTFLVDVFAPDILKSYYESYKNYTCLSIKDFVLTTTVVFPYHGNTVYEHTYKYYFDNNYNIQRVDITTIKRLLSYSQQTLDTYEIMYNSTLQRLNNYTPNFEVYEYENEKEFKTNEIYYTF